MPTIENHSGAQLPDEPEQADLNAASPNWPLIRARLAFLAVASVCVPVLAQNCDRLATQTIEAYETPGCRYGEYISPTDLSRSQIIGDVRNMKFVLNHQQYDRDMAEVNAAQTDKQIAQVLENTIFKPYHIGVSVNDLPEQRLGILPMPNMPSWWPVKMHSSVGHTSLSNIKSAVGNFLKDGLSYVPSSFLKEVSGSRLYLDWRPDFQGSASEGAVGDYLPVQGHFMMPHHDSIILDLSDKSIGYDYFHELNHNLETRQCGNGINFGGQVSGHDYNEFSKINPKGFKYVSDSGGAKHYVEEGTLATSNGLVIDPYADFAPLEDVAETGASLLEGGFDNSLDSTAKLSPTVFAKQKLVIARQSLIEPDLSAYYYYLANDDSDPFPADTIKTDNPTSDCFGDPRVTDGQFSFTSMSPAVDLQEQGHIINGYIDSEPHTGRLRFHYGLILSGKVKLNVAEADVAESAQMSLFLDGRLPYVSNDLTFIGWKAAQIGKTTINCVGFMINS